MSSAAHIAAAFGGFASDDRRDRGAGDPSLSTGKSTVKAFVDIRLGGIALKGCKIVQQDGQRPWLATPAVKTDHGWPQIAEFASKELRERVTAVVRAAAWERGQ